MDRFAIANRYEIHKCLGTTGNITLYLAYDTVKGVDVFVNVAAFSKLSSETWANLLAYYENLTRWRCKASWPFIWPVADFGEIVLPKMLPAHRHSLLENLSLENINWEDANLCYFANEKKSEWQMLEEVQGKNASEILKYISPTLEAFGKLHDKGIFYSYLTPFHILCKKGELPEVSFLNVGIIPPECQFFSESEYIAPEIVHFASYDSRADIYSFGAVFFKKITGKSPFGKNEAQKRECLATAQIPQNVADILIRCLRESPSDRFPDASQLASAFLETLPDLPPCEILPRRFILRNFCPIPLVEELQKEVEDFLAGKGQEKAACCIHLREGEGKTTALQKLGEICLSSGGEVFTVLSAPVLSTPSPLFPLQSLWNLFQQLGIESSVIRMDETAHDVRLASDDFCLTPEEIYLHFRETLVQEILYKCTKPTILLWDNVHYATKEELDILRSLLIAIAAQQEAKTPQTSKNKEKNKNTTCRLLVIMTGLLNTAEEEKGVHFLSMLRHEPLLKEKILTYMPGRWTQEQTNVFIADSLGIQKAPEKFARYMGELTSSHPLHVFQILTILIRKGLLYREREDWCIQASSLDDLPVPGSLTEATSVYFEMLSPCEKEILTLLSRCGSVRLRFLLQWLEESYSEGIAAIWKLFQDRIISISQTFCVSLSNEIWHSYLEKYHNPQNYHGNRIAEMMEQGIIKVPDKFFLAHLYHKSHDFSKAFLYYRDALRILLFWGMHHCGIAWFKNFQEMATGCDIENIAGFLKMALDIHDRNATADFLAGVEKRKDIPPECLLDLAKLELEHQNIALAEQYKENVVARVESKCIESGLCHALDGRIYEHRQQWEMAKASFRKALEIFFSIWNEPQKKERAFHCLLDVLKHEFVLENTKGIQSFLTDALEMAKSLNRTSSDMVIFYLLGTTQKYSGDWQKALENLQKSLDMAKKACYPLLESNALLEIAEIYLCLGDIRKGISFFSRASVLCKRYGFKSLKAKRYLLKAQIACAKNKFELAGLLYKETIRLLQKHRDMLSNQQNMTLMAIASARLSQLILKSEGMAYWKKAYNLARQLHYPRIQLHVTLVRIMLEESGEENPNAILTMGEKGVELAKDYGYTEYLWQLYYHIGMLFRASGNMPKAMENFHKAQKTLLQNAEKLPGELRESYMKRKSAQSLGELVSTLTTELPMGQPSGLSGKQTEELSDNLENASFENKDDVSEEDSSYGGNTILGYQHEADLRLIKKQREEIASIRKLLEINKILNTEHELHKLLPMIMDTAIEITKAERGFLILNTTSEEKAFEVARNFEKEDISNPQFEISHSITEKVIRTGIPILATDAVQDERFEGYQSVSELKLHSVLAVPLRIREMILGAVYIDNRFEKAVFTEKEKALLEAFAEQASIAIHNTRLLAENMEKQKKLLESKEKIEQLNFELAAANAKLAQKVESREEELKDVKSILHKNHYEMEKRYRYHNLVAKSQAMQEIFRILDKVADKNIPVYIYGESGTGKELVARAIHFNGHRKEKNFLSENCASISETLLASELFGHEKGSFTGAYATKKGLFELADGGTLFLDEVGDMSPGMQANLLRVLERNVIRRVGGKEEIPVDVRIISASNQDLRELTNKGSFREDLFFRLRVVQISLPPLRERKEDIPLLADTFLQEYAKENNTSLRKLDKKAIQFLTSYPWPGNVRELRNTLYNVLSLNDDMELTVSHFYDLTTKPVQRADDFFQQEMSIDEYARVFVLKKQDKYNDSQIAKILGFSRKTLWEKRKKWGLMKS